MPRLVRRAPPLERLKAYLDPYDFLLWLAEAVNDDAWHDALRHWATPLGIALNFLFILARASAGASSSPTGGRHDDVFGDHDAKWGSGWLSSFATFLVHLLTLLCCANAFYTFARKRHYRLFEQPVDVAPSTPSAQRVRVDSSPSSSPLRLLQNALQNVKNSAGARAYPDAERDVWEVAVWDPRPTNLTLFTLFSPGHILLYSSLLPPAATDARPSTTVLTAILFGALLSVQLAFLKTSFARQAHDRALVHGEVLAEYDTKYVRPTLQRPMRDVGTQTRDPALVGSRAPRSRDVDTYPPTTLVRRAFRTNPNPNYAAQYDPDGLGSHPAPLTASIHTNGYAAQASHARPSTSSAPDFSSPLKPHHARLRAPSPPKGDGGSLGVFTHAASPLRKTASSSYLRPGTEGSEGLGLARRQGSPLKRMSTPGGGVGRETRL